MPAPVAVEPAGAWPTVKNFNPIGAWIGGYSAGLFKSGDFCGIRLACRPWPESLRCAVTIDAVLGAGGAPRFIEALQKEPL